jgi:hypothetical protein
LTKASSELDVLGSTAKDTSSREVGRAVGIAVKNRDRHVAFNLVVERLVTISDSCGFKHCIVLPTQPQAPPHFIIAMIDPERTVGSYASVACLLGNPECHRSKNQKASKCRGNENRDA